MRIKEIEWDRSGIIQTASLPFMCEAKIWQAFNLDAHRWAIARGSVIVRSGTTTTIEEAMEACQAAWEKMIKEALEPSDLYVISTEEGIDSICTSADEAKIRQQEVMACSGCMEGFVIVEEFVVDLDGNVTEVEYEE